MKFKFFLSLLMLTVAVALWAQKTDVDTTKTDTRSLAVFTDVKDHITHEPIKGVKAELVWAADSTHADTVHVEYQEDEYYKSSFIQFPIKQAGNYLVKVEAEGYTTLLVDDGDAIQGEAIGTLCKGEVIVELMNELGEHENKKLKEALEEAKSQLKELLGVEDASDEQTEG